MKLLRSSLLYLSRSKRAQKLLMRFPLSHRLARRFVPGEKLEEAIATVQELNNHKMVALIDFLGENVRTEEEAVRAAQEYLHILDKIAESKVNSYVSLKLTQMGLDISPKLCLENLQMILDKAQNQNNLVEIDMEDSAHVEPTLNIFLKLRERYDNIGIAIQAYLYRSEKDIAKLIERGCRVRLCKGAYDEPHTVAFPRKRDVDANYIRLLKMFWSGEARDSKAYPAIATHDEKIIRWAKRFAAENNIDKSRFEFQMLYGIRRDLQQELADESYTVRVYVTYGSQWYPFFMRRLAERPANLIFLMKNLLRG